MDVLSDVLATVRLTGAVHICPELSAPWGLAFPEQPDRAVFYVLSRGSCYLEVEGQEAPVTLVGGDLVMLPHGAAHVLRDQPQTPAIPVEALMGEGCCSPSRALQHGGGGEKSALVAGYFQFENRTAGRLLSALPPLIHVRAEAAQSVPWLEAILRFLSFEANTNLPGSEIVMARLTDVLFIQILRAFIAHEESEGRTCDRHAGILRALVDPDLSKALTLMHQRPDHAWTVGELARGVGMSRTGFAVRFKEKAGVSPLDYLTQWRMQKAGDLLRAGEENLEEIAVQVGYESGAALSKAFKREMGIPPGLYRKEQPGAAN
jgi:AraC-like DNA-binding protein